jgi:hypothetical protein
MACGEADNDINSVCEYDTHHINLLMMEKETVSETSDINSKLTELIL